jgi:DNA-binding HxlR family transcriptional regulator
MAKRSYDQYCPLARSLDLLGERWTMLILRDLLAGPRRYTDLRNELEGIPSDLLTSRLRQLEGAGVIERRRLPAPAASTVYELTELGRELEPALLSLARFGLGLLDPETTPTETPSPDRLGLLLKVLFDPSAAGEGPRAVALQSSDGGLWVSFGDDGFAVGREEEEPPVEIEATAHGAPGTLYDLLLGRRETSEEIARGDLEIDGDGEALGAMLAAFPGPEST